jgi:hypothetical protein
MRIERALPSMTLTMFVNVSGVTATAVAAANPAVFQSAITWAECLPAIALAVVKHAPDPTARIVNTPPITL